MTQITFRFQFMGRKCSQPTIALALIHLIAEHVDFFSVLAFFSSPTSSHALLPPVLIIIFAMNSSSQALGALILVPIAIALGAAFLAVKTVGLFEYIFKLVQPYFDAVRKHHYDKRQAKGHGKRHRLRKSNLRIYQTWGDSWQDLESCSSREETYSRFIGQAKSSQASSNTSSNNILPIPEPAQVWHPSRSNRMSWSFTNPRSSSRSLYESLSVARPSPVARRAECRSADVVLLMRHGKAKAVRPSVRTVL